MDRTTYNEVSVENQHSKIMQKIYKSIIVYARNLIYLIVTPYSILKHFSSQKEITFIQNCLLILKSIGLLLITTLIYLIFGLYKKIVEIILKLRLGEKFVQIVSGPDALLSWYDVDSGLISIIMLIETSKTSDELCEELKQRVNKYFFIDKTNKKYFSLKKIFMGHMYLEHTHKIGINDVFLKMTDDPKTDFDALIYKNSKNPAPLNGSFNWDILFYTHPYKIVKDNRSVFVLQMRIHHLVADGIVIHNILTNVFGKVSNTKIKDVYSKSFNSQSEGIKINTNLKNFKNLGIKPNNLIYNGLTNSKTTCYLFGEETGEYFNKIKAIKSKFEGVPFFAVLMAAYSASLSEYIINNSTKESDLVENMNLVAPVQINKKRVEKYYSSKKCDELTNDFSLCPFILPVVPKDKIGVPLEDYMIERLMYIKKEFQLIANSSDSLVIYILMKTIVNVLPYYFARKLDPPLYTGVVSHVPGGPQISVFNGDVANQVTFFLPRLPHYGIAFYFVTYGDRLSFSLLGDRDKFATRDDLKKFGENILKYLDVLDEQSKNKTK